MAPSPSRIAAQEGDAYADSTMIKMQRLVLAMDLSPAEPAVKESFHETLCKKSLQDIAWIHAQLDYANPFPLSSEEITKGLINPFVEYESLLHEMQALKGQIGLLNSDIALPSLYNLPAAEIDSLPTLIRINLFRRESHLPLIENIPNPSRLAKPFMWSPSDVIPNRISELKDIIRWYKKAHLYLEVEAARCKILLTIRHRDLLDKPDNGFASRPPSGVKQSQIYEDDCGKPATQGQLD
ncbi:hypothetical protein N7519_010002 [Penicillium mononematosum]|uniref:uncharacterized protein n=1 Tax=Penicillium mononematosum TaxID=268346 RepID=UPI0025475A36|nr:uncharacterized protein N7519_010002 [Penicillium mononematosum]KAJ6179541.1 hypothetical protein N7519_010002 [Penicillium mononematosum]